MSSDNSFRNTFLTQLLSINIRSKEFPNILTKMLASPEGVNTAMLLQGDDALTLVDILDQAFEAPNMSLDLRKRCVRILRRVCGLQMILPRSCVISDNISEGEIWFASGGFANVWKGRHNENPVCIKAFRAYTAEDLGRIKQRLFHEIVIWRRLSHPNVLPVLGVSPKLFPLCIVSEWMIDGNIMDFTSRYPEVNRLRLLAEVASGLQYLHSTEIIHCKLKPKNILIDSNFRPRLTNYGLVAIMLDPNIHDPGGTTCSPTDTVRYMAPELLNPAGFGLDTSNPTKKSDVYAFGIVTYQVITGQLPYPGAKDGVIIYNAVSGERPARPSGPNEWLSDDVWNFVSRCLSASWDGRPDVDFAINTLNDAADAVEVGWGKAQVINDQGKGAAHHDSVKGSIPNRESTRSPFVVRKLASSKAGEKERKRLRQKGFRTWHDSTGLYQHEAALVDYKNGIVHLSSFSGARIEIPEGRLAQEDITYLRSQKPQRSGIIGIILWLILGKKDGADEVAQNNVPLESHSDMRGNALQPRQTSTSSATQTESWQADLDKFLQACKAGVKDDLERRKAQGFVDGLDMALVGGDLPQQKQKNYLRHLRKLCGSFNILPSSFSVQQTFDEFATEPSAFGGFSNVFEATLEGRHVAVKTLRATNTGNLERAHRLLVKEVVGWKWLQHENILPFIGVALTPPFFSIISEWMENGDITRFTRTHPNYNRLCLLADTVAGLDYLHEHSIIHGDLKGANILIGPDRRAMLADFGLTAVIDESAAGSVVDNNGIRGTLRWMAPELMYPDGFGFTKECRIRLPSRGTDIYALGMTILEVITGCRPYNDIAAEGAVMCKVLKGVQPDRPPSGFTDPLWELLVATWLAEHGSQPPKRPQTSTIRDRLNEEVNNWGTLIFPPPVVENTVDDTTENDPTVVAAYPI